MAGPLFQQSTTQAALAVSLVALAACAPDVAPASVPRPAAQPAHAIEVWIAPGTGAIATQLRDLQGNPVYAKCSTCHGGPLKHDASGRDKPGAFHKDVQTSHGTLSCFSCHDRADRDRLHLADGQTVAFPEVVTLCRQCHAMQGRDFDHGAHGGMNGHWDLTRGPRTRNSCTTCHAAHAPKYPRFQPVLPPRDRFLHGKSHGDGPGAGGGHP